MRASGQGSPHLLLVSHNYAPEPTGIPYYNTDFAEWLVEQGWQVSVATGLPHYPWWNVPEEYLKRSYAGGKGDEIIQGVHVLRVRHFVPAPPAGALGRMRLDASYLLAWVWRMWTLRHRPDAIVLIAPPFLIGFLGLLLRFRFATGGKRLPLLYHVQDLQVDAALDLGMLPERVGGILRFLERIQLARMDAVTTCSTGMAIRLAGKGPTRRRVRVWPNWTDTLLMRPPQGPNGYRQEWGVSPDDIIVLYSGNLGKKQGLDDLLTAADLLRDDKRFHWVIAGQGAERAELERTASELRLPRLSFLDLQPKSRLPEFLAAADIHLLPQKRAAADLVMPSKLVNILAVGRPLVVAADPETELGRTVRSAGCGELVPPEEPQAMAAAILRLAASSSHRQLAGHQGQAFARSRLDRQPVLSAVQACLRRLMRSRRSR